MSALLHRIAQAPRVDVSFVLDGQGCTAQQGDTVLTAILTQATRLRASEFGGTPRAGFCLMGACQDCWVTTEDGQRLRACSTLIDDGMRLRTKVGT
ncbi:MAG: (2Fe-2S)-binding protein [Burkholderiales bacterium]